MMRWRARVALAAAVLAVTGNVPARAQLRFADHADRQTLRGWFVLLADAAFYQPPTEVIDCAALVRYALREAVRPHTPEWLRQAGLPIVPALPDLRDRPRSQAGVTPLFRVAGRADAPLAEFADAKTIIRWNTRLISRDAGDARPGDLLYYRQPSQRQPDHLMILVGPSRVDSSASDFIVYHTGANEDGPGELRKVRLADLLQHPAPRWRPVAANRAFIGVFRLVAFI